MRAYPFRCEFQRFRGWERLVSGFVADVDEQSRQPDLSRESRDGEGVPALLHRFGDAVDETENRHRKRQTCLEVQLPPSTADRRDAVREGSLFCYSPILFVGCLSLFLFVFVCFYCCLSLSLFFSILFFFFLPFFFFS